MAKCIFFNSFQHKHYFISKFREDIFSSINAKRNYKRFTETIFNKNVIDDKYNKHAMAIK